MANEQITVSPIFTLNSRGYIMLEVLRDHYGLIGAKMKNEIQTLYGQLLDVLKAKRIDYNELRAGLVPIMDKHEALFIFDSQKTGSNNYGRDIFNQLLPLLDPRTTQSILVGDLISEDQPLIFDILKNYMTFVRPSTFLHSTLLFGVYINNLSASALARIDTSLVKYQAYLGHIPMTFMSPAKIYASTTMAGFLLKKGKTLILAHEDDRPNNEDINITLYELEQFGYKVKSLQSMYFGIFLTYKIECPILIGGEADNEISLNSISASVLPLDEFKVLLEEDKFGYLINEKLGKLKQAGLEALDVSKIESIIKSKINGSYIYNLKYLAQHNVMIFNIMLEIHNVNGYPTRLTAALEYIPDKKTLRVITLH